MQLNSLQKARRERVSRFVNYQMKFLLNGNVLYFFKYILVEIIFFFTFKIYFNSFLEIIVLKLAWMSKLYVPYIRTTNKYTMLDSECRVLLCKWGQEIKIHWRQTGETAKQKLFRKFRQLIKSHQWSRATKTRT